MTYRMGRFCTSLVLSHSGAAEAEQGSAADSGADGTVFKFDMATTRIFEPCRFRRTDAEPPLRVISINAHSRNAGEVRASRKTPTLMAPRSSTGFFGMTRKATHRHPLPGIAYWPQEKNENLHGTCRPHERPNLAADPSRFTLIV